MRQDTDAANFNVSQSSAITDDNDRLVTEARLRDIYNRMANMVTGGGEFELFLNASWRGSLRWSRNRVSMAGDQRNISLSIWRRNKYGTASTTINQVDDTSLANAMKDADRMLNRRVGVIQGLSSTRPFYGKKFHNMPQPYAETAIWSEATFNVLPEQRAKIAQTLMQGAEAQSLLSAGYLEMSVWEQQRFGDSIEESKSDWKYSNEAPQGHGATRTARDEGYVRYTTSECSMTVRHPKGLGSGWVGQSGYDWSVIDAPTLAQRALDKCVKSMNPVSIEPGRYVVILEPQAVADFASDLVESMRDRQGRHEDRPGVWSDEVDPVLGLRMTKLGQRVIDERITISSDPMDPRLGTIPQLGMRPMTLVEKGRLTTLTYGRQYGLQKLREDAGQWYGGRPFLMTGGTTSMEEMIATTTRGLIVTRFSNVTPVRGAHLSLLCTGLTRDGLWLVENGKITKAVKNMRFTDSPLFAFNQVDQLGVPVPVFGGIGTINPPIVPPIKTKEFSFTSTIDAI